MLNKLIWSATLVVMLSCSVLGSGISTISSNFNGTAIAGGNVIWFNSVLKPSGLGATPVTFTMTNSQVSFAGAVPNPLNLPNVSVTFSPTATLSTTTFNSGTNTWTTLVPNNLSGNTFLDGFGFTVPAGGLPGGINPVAWSGHFFTDTPGTTLQWQWAAAVYTNFSSNLNALDVKPIDANTPDWPNSDHAGTPEEFTDFVTGGARGGGGSNFTGSYSATASVTPDPVAAVPDASTIVLACFGTLQFLAVRKKLFR